MRADHACPAIMDTARITGNIDMGDGDDTLTFASAAARIAGLADGGADMDTLDGLSLFTEAAATTLFRHTNFEDAGDTGNDDGQWRRCPGGCYYVSVR